MLDKCDCDYQNLKFKNFLQIKIPDLYSIYVHFLSLYVRFNIYLYSIYVDIAKFSHNFYS